MTEKQKPKEVDTPVRIDPTIKCIHEEEENNQCSQRKNYFEMDGYTCTSPHCNFYEPVRGIIIRTVAHAGDYLQVALNADEYRRIDEYVVSNDELFKYTSKLVDNYKNDANHQAMKEARDCLKNIKDNLEKNIEKSWIIKKLSSIQTLLQLDDEHLKRELISGYCLEKMECIRCNSPLKVRTNKKSIQIYYCSNENCRAIMIVNENKEVSWKEFLGNKIKEEIED